VTLQCPIKSTVPKGTKCGRRERESRREGRREQSLRAHDSFAWRGGERHPGLLEGGTLRGASSERGPRSVRLLSWVPPTNRGAPMTADVRRTPRRGTPSACATKRMHPTQAREIVACARGRVLHSVLRPVHTGLLAPVGDWQAFARAIIRMLASQTLRDMCGHAGVQRAQTYAWPRVVEHNVQLYHRLIRQQCTASCRLAASGQ
jgi:hypothetical protein